jgi:integrase
LKWPQVNFDEGYISLVGQLTKTHRSRIIPLTPAAISALKELKTNRNHSDLVFPQRGNSEKPRDRHMAFNKAVERAKLTDLHGVGKLRIHDLRHICGTFLVMNGVDIETVRDILGHRDLSTTQRYLHIVHEHKKKAISKLNNLGIYPDS